MLKIKVCRSVQNINGMSGKRRQSLHGQKKAFQDQFRSGNKSVGTGKGSPPTTGGGGADVYSDTSAVSVKSRILHLPAAT